MLNSRICTITLVDINNRFEIINLNYKIDGNSK